MEDVEKQNRCNLIAVCMKELFENRLLEKMSKGVGIKELDKWLDPSIKGYFMELDAVNRYFNPEDYEDSSCLLLDEHHICEEKCGLITYCLQLMMKKEATDILNSAKTLSEADEKLKLLIQKTKDTGTFIRSWYGLDTQDEPDSETE